MAKNGTPVRCNECGHEWETVADNPQCSDPNDVCGRSRDVEPVNGANGEGGASSERDSTPSGDSQSENEWSPLFDAQNTETEPVEDMSFDERPELEDDHFESQPERADSEGERAGESPGPDMPDLEPDDIELFVKTPFDMAARTRGEHWELSDDELDQLSHAYAKVGNKYAPYLLKEHAPEVMAMMVTMSVVGPRLAEDKRQKEQKEKRSKDDESKDESDRRTADETETETETEPPLAGAGEQEYSWAKV